MRSALLPFLLVPLAALWLLPPPARARERDDRTPLIEPYLTSGKLAEGIAASKKHLREHPRDDQARFGLGAAQFLQAVEHLSQSMYRYGLGNEHNRWLRQNIPLLRLPVPENPRPKVLSYTELRNMLQTWVDDLQDAEATLAEIRDGDVRLPLHFGQILLDLRGEGRADPEDTFWKVYARVNGQAAGISAEQARAFLVCFHRGDVHWLRGYCHLLMALGEVGLAYDGKELFESTAFLIFPRVETPHDFLEVEPGQNGFLPANFVDIISFIHLVRLPVKEADRMKVALRHLEQMIAQSKESWQWIMAETEDDYNWIPNPKQKGVIPGVRVTKEMVDSWRSFLDEADDLLAGKKLVPFWRGRAETRGVNLRKVFTDPRPLDLVLWVQGTAATPYLERGEVTRPEVWGRLQRVFGGEFVGFALWFN